MSIPQHGAPGPRLQTTAYYQWQTLICKAKRHGGQYLLAAICTLQSAQDIFEVCTHKPVVSDCFGSPTNLLQLYQPGLYIAFMICWQKGLCRFAPCGL
jgi:hypothetical protein